MKALHRSLTEADGRRLEKWLENKGCCCDHDNPCNGECVPGLIERAWNEIHSLRAQLAEVTRERDELRGKLFRVRLDFTSETLEECRVMVTAERQRAERADAEAEQLRVQLAGCMTAACGAFGDWCKDPSTIPQWVKDQDPIYARGVADERARVVAWLRRIFCSWESVSDKDSAAYFAGLALNDELAAIERGEHVAPVENSRSGRVCKRCGRLIKAWNEQRQRAERAENALTDIMVAADEADDASDGLLHCRDIARRTLAEHAKCSG